MWAIFSARWQEPFSLLIINIHIYLFLNSSTIFSAILLRSLFMLMCMCLDDVHCTNLNKSYVSLSVVLTGHSYRVRNQL